ncbi:MAG: ATP-binding cassette domain-containing protein [Erysipelotrichaceae bacterium]|nr:ATP-binding cassette domain-containing protein [Solobacterium sp.]MCI7445407.1 ATP-binding cassette domain-containing protein [Solobacterium sp.]MDD7775504.1 ATP-binding cassette domain-containing protein [Solobacterium sp.]MDY2952990.1 ATP-binding cassette domain-containing protein [Erysipelotrichaceae bacterium]MDY3794631.1 ATP-binding cassette domain-containing protein [Erysipelotrichaceae bacterium]
MTIKCIDLDIGYDGKAVVSGLNLKINDGDYLCIVGENGSGKTTLMKTLLGLIPLLGGSIQGLNKNDIGYLPQISDIQKDFPATVEEVVLSGTKKLFYRKKEKDLMRFNLERLNIANLSKCKFSELSGGQRQRVLLARALCASKKILLLDEPVSGLDPKATAMMYEIINKLNKEDGMTIIMISHDLNGSLKYASNVLNVGEK